MKRLGPCRRISRQRPRAGGIGSSSSKAGAIFADLASANVYDHLMKFPVFLACFVLLLVPQVAQAHSGQSHQLQLPSGRMVMSGEAKGPAQSATNTAAFVIGGHRWPGRSITYYDATVKANYRKGVATAIAEWNSRGLPIKFRKVSSRSSAQFVIQTDHKIAPGGYATVGYWGRGSYYVQLNMDSYRWDDVAWVASHELGHILGLGHSKGCAVMSYAAYATCKWPDKQTQWRCRLQERDDLLGVKRLYGGSFVVRASPFCMLHPISGPVTGVIVQPAPEPGFATISWNAAAGAAGGYRIARSSPGGPCPTGIDGVPVADTKALTYTEQAPAYQPMGDGAYCYTVWSMNVDGYVNLAAPGRATFTYAAPPVPVPAGVSIVPTFTGYTDPYDPSYSSQSWDVAIHAPVPAGANIVTVQRNLGSTCTATDPSVGFLQTTINYPDMTDRIDPSSPAGAAHGSTVCYRLWSGKYSAGGTTRYSAPVDIVITLP